jgi:hypothetical protein
MADKTARYTLEFRGQMCCGISVEGARSLGHDDRDV